MLLPKFDAFNMFQSWTAAAKDWKVVEQSKTPAWNIPIESFMIEYERGILKTTKQKTISCAFV